MSKPLELTIHPLPALEGDRPKDRLKHEFAKGAQQKQAEAKRLTDAELAAITWHLTVSYFVEDSGEERRERARENMIAERFATHPDYDEVTA